MFLVYPHCSLRIFSTSAHAFQSKLEFWCFVLEKRRKYPILTWRKSSWTKGNNQEQTEPTCNIARVRICPPAHGWLLHPHPLLCLFNLNIVEPNGYFPLSVCLTWLLYILLISVFSLAGSPQLILEISTTYRLVCLSACRLVTNL